MIDRNFRNYVSSWRTVASVERKKSFCIDNIGRIPFRIMEFDHYFCLLFPFIFHVFVIFSDLKKKINFDPGFLYYPTPNDRTDGITKGSGFNVVSDEYIFHFEFFDYL